MKRKPFTRRQFMATSIAAKYSYNFSWLGRPIIQYPQDIVAMQELIWSLQPELIVETGMFISTFGVAENQELLVGAYFADGTPTGLYRLERGSNP
jgi:hypothetical protein